MVRQKTLVPRSLPSDGDEPRNAHLSLHIDELHFAGLEIGDKAVVKTADDKIRIEPVE
jgi:hypothetical protein